MVFPINFYGMSPFYSTHSPSFSKPGTNVTHNATVWHQRRQLTHYTLSFNYNTVYKMATACQTAVFRSCLRLHLNWSTHTCSHVCCSSDVPDTADCQIFWLRGNLTVEFNVKISLLPHVSWDVASAAVCTSPNELKGQHTQQHLNAPGELRFIISSRALSELARREGATNIMWCRQLLLQLPWLLYNLWFKQMFAIK